MTTDDISHSTADTVTVVLPTYNRAEALRVNLRSTLAMTAVDEVIIVNDGSDDDTVAVCEAVEDSRVRLISHSRNLGVAAARNTGIAAATGEWVLFSEDDCGFPSDYVEVLLAEARRLSADVIGAPLVNVFGKTESAADIAAKSPRVATYPMDGTSAFPIVAMETPFVPARALVRRSVLDRVRFYEDFAVNGYREETDFFVRASRAGFRCMVTPETCCYQTGYWDGGQHHAHTVRYEYWALRNNWRFLRRHEKWLVSKGYIASATRAQLQFGLRRLSELIEGVAKSRLYQARRLVTRAIR